MKGKRRFGTITRILARHGFGNVIDHMFTRNQAEGDAESELNPTARSAFHSPARIRLMLEELGPSFIKLGQLMSVRADVFPPEYTEEFKKLQDSVPPVSFASIKAVIDAELGTSVDDIFAEISPKALAARPLPRSMRPG